jgi:hypothetical protein
MEDEGDNIDNNELIPIENDDSGYLSKPFNQSSLQNNPIYNENSITSPTQFNDNNQLNININDIGSCPNSASGSSSVTSNLDSTQNGVLNCANCSSIIDFDDGNMSMSSSKSKINSTTTTTTPIVYTIYSSYVPKCSEIDEDCISKSSNKFSSLALPKFLLNRTKPIDTFSEEDDEELVISLSKLDNPFVLFVCLAIFIEHKDHIMKNEMDANDIACYFDKMMRKQNMKTILNRARDLYTRMYLSKNNVFNYLNNLIFIQKS